MWLSARGDDAATLLAAAILMRLVVVVVVVQKQKWKGRRGGRRHLHCKTMVIVTSSNAGSGSCSAAAAGICGLGPEQLNVVIVVDFRQFRVFAVREELRHEVIEQAVPLVDDLAEEVLQVTDPQLGLLPRGPADVHQLAAR